MFFFTLICLCLFALYGVLIDYYRRAWKAISYSSLPDGPAQTSREAAGAAAPRTKISVLVPARNEETNIRTCLQSLSQQSYPKNRYEVIVIDDHSTDRTASIVKEFEAGGMSLRCLSLSEAEAAAGAEREAPVKSEPKSPAKDAAERAVPEKLTGPAKAYKKFAIETGIRAATGELILTTDADCQCPAGWLQTMAGFYEETGAKFIAAPVRIAEPGNPGSNSSFLVLFQTLDFITLQGITGAAVYKQFHSMCNGANLAYERKVFFEVDGFKDIDDIPSGDDMLLMHKIYSKYPQKVFFLKNPQAIVSTRPQTSWGGFVNQRVRWASKAARYEDKRIFWVLLLVYLLNLLFIGLLLASWWNSWYLWLLLILLTIKTSVEFPFVRSVAAFFGQRQLMVYFPALQPAHIIYTVVIGWLGQFGSYRWKERTIK